MLRSADRTRNADCYPQLTYPDVYLLLGGYSNFVKEQGVSALTRR